MYVFVTCLAPRRVGLAGGVEVLVVCHISLSLVNMLVLRAPPPRSQTQPATVGGQKREGRVRKRRGLRFSTAGAANKERDRQTERPST